MSDTLKKIATRTGCGEALREFGGDTRIIVMDADLGKSTMSNIFGEKYPERYFDVGIAEANMAGVAAGFASTGKIVFIHSFAIFATGRIYDQIRNSIAYPRLNVKIIGSHGGLTVGPDGATHQALEDLSLMRSIPGMTVICPCDANETRLAVKAMIEYDGPCYMRTGRLPVAQITNTLPGYDFQLGKGVTLKEGTDAAILATGYMVAQAIKAGELLAGEGINARIINIHTLKPLDADIVLQAARETGALVTAEEHSVIGGLGSAVAELLAENCPAPLERVGVRDKFGRTGEPEELVELYNIAPQDIADAVKKAIARR